MKNVKNRRSRWVVVSIVATLALPASGCGRGEDRGRMPRTGEVRELLQQVLDRQDIQELLTEYMRRLEARDWARYADLFVSSGELHFNDNHFVGSQVIRDSMTKLAPSDPKNPPPAAADLLTNVSITVTGETATSTSRWTGIQLGADNKPAVTRAGHYEDTLVREDGRWKFQKRIVHVDVTPVVPAPTGKSGS
jgi:hypothetical protein